MRKSNDFYKLSNIDKDKVLFFYFAPEGTGKEYWKNKVKELKKGVKDDKRN